MRTDLIAEIAAEVGLEDLIFEAPTKASQAWFVKQFGPTVNLGNIPPDEVIPLETLRLGPRGDTLKEGLLHGDPPPAALARLPGDVPLGVPSLGLRRVRRQALPDLA